MANKEIDTIFFAVYDGDFESIRTYLAKGGSPNLQNEDGKSLLHVACIDGYSGLLESLLESGADPNIEDNEGDTPLDYAAFANYKEIQEILIRYGALVRDRQPAVQRNSQLIQEGQDDVRAMQNLFCLINKKSNPDETP